MGVCVNGQRADNCGREMKRSLHQMKGGEATIGMICLQYRQKSFLDVDSLVNMSFFFFFLLSPITVSFPDT